MAKQTPRTTESDVATAVAAVVEAKRSFRAVAKEYGVSHVQVRRWVMAWKIANPGWDGVPSSGPVSVSNGQGDEVDTEAPSPAPWAGLVLNGEITTPEAERPPMPEADTTVPTDPITVMQGIIQEIQTQIRQNKLVGRVEVVSKLTTNLVMVSNNLARAIEKSSKADGAIVVTKDEAISIEQDLERRQTAEVGERPLLCAHCGKELSILWGTGGNSGEPRE